MADKWNRDDDNVSGKADEELRGVADDVGGEDEFADADDDLDDEEDEESTTF